MQISVTSPVTANDNDFWDTKRNQLFPADAAVSVQVLAKDREWKNAVLQCYNKNNIKKKSSTNCESSDLEHRTSVRTRRATFETQQLVHQNSPFTVDEWDTSEGVSSSRLHGSGQRNLVNLLAIQSRTRSVLI